MLARVVSGRSLSRPRRRPSQSTRAPRRDPGARSRRRRLAERRRRPTPGVRCARESPTTRSRRGSSSNSTIRSPAPSRSRTARDVVARDARTHGDREPNELEDALRRLPALERRELVGAEDEDERPAVARSSRESTVRAWRSSSTIASGTSANASRASSSRVSQASSRPCGPDRRRRGRAARRGRARSTAARASAT